MGSRGTNRGQVGLGWIRCSQLDSSWQYGEMFGVWVGKTKRISERLGKRLIERFGESLDKLFGKRIGKSLMRGRAKL